jgi:hypothetical protein
MSRFGDTCRYIYYIGKNCFDGLRSVFGFGPKQNAHDSDQSGATTTSGDEVHSQDVVSPARGRVVASDETINEEAHDFTDVELEVERPNPLHIPEFHAHHRTANSVIAHDVGEVTGHVLKLSQAAVGMVTSPLSPQSVGSTLEAAYEVANAAVNLAGDVTTVVRGYNILGNSQQSVDSE